jgi:hypothetical protein
VSEFGLRQYLNRFFHRLPDAVALDEITAEHIIALIARMRSDGPALRNKLSMARSVVCPTALCGATSRAAGNTVAMTRRPLAFRASRLPVQRARYDG